jgi:sugar lactone lactonase YvrE
VVAGLFSLVWLMGPGSAQEYTFITLAGPAEAGPDWFDGTGDAARFGAPCGVAVDSAGNVYVADYGNNTIRKVSAAGVVTTLAGLAGSSGSADGPGAAARFLWPSSVAVDSEGNVYVADAGNHTIRRVTPAGLVTTLAGLAGSPGSADGPANVARFHGPASVAADSGDNVYVADAGNHTIRKVTPAGVVTTLAGLAGSPGSANGPGSTARLYQPSGVAVDTSGNVYVGDYYNHTIRKVTPAGVVTTLAGLARNSGSYDATGAAARFYYPCGVAVDTSGNVYVGDYYNHTIRKVTPAGVVTTLAGLARNSGSYDGTGSAARFNGPWGVAVDSGDNVYVADRSNAAIRKVTPPGVVTTPAGPAQWFGATDGAGCAARFYQPSGVAVDSERNAFVADKLNHTIRKVTSAGQVTTLAGLAGSPGSADGLGSAARFRQPSAAAVDLAGNVYVADESNHTIRKVTPAGLATTLAGLAGSAGSADGAATEARFYQPSSVAVDSDDNVYVADQMNHTVRRVTPAGLVTTLAGLAGNYGSTDGMGGAARFYSLEGLALDGEGNLYVADTGNHTIRKVTPAGVVTTLAGLADSYGGTDGTGSTARFYWPLAVAVDSATNVLVAEGGNHTLRQVTPAGVVTTLAGMPGRYGSADGTGSAARFCQPWSVAVDSEGKVYVADKLNHRIRRSAPTAPDRPLVDLSVAPVGLTRQLDISNFTATAWSWSLVRQPTGSAAVLSAPKARNPTFKPDMADLYVFRLMATNAAGAISIRTLEFTATPAVWLEVAGADSSRLMLVLRGDAGKPCEVWASPNLRDWSLFTTITNFTGRADFTDSITNAPCRFYRLRQLL